MTKGTKDVILDANSFEKVEIQEEEGNRTDPFNLMGIKEESERSSFSNVEQMNYMNSKKMIRERYSSSSIKNIYSGSGGETSLRSLARIDGSSKSGDDEFPSDVNQNSMNTLNASTLTFNLNDSTQNFHDSTQIFSSSTNDTISVKMKEGEDDENKNNENDNDNVSGDSNKHCGMCTTFIRNEKVKSALQTIQKLRLQCGKMVNNNYVQLVMIVFIIINAGMMGIATFKIIKENAKYLDAFEKTDKAFLIIFTIELVMQCIYHGHKLLYDGWLVFDLIIILTSWVFSKVPAIQAFRIFRAFRLITRISIMRNLIVALVNVMPRMAAIALMLCLIFYIFSVMFTQLFSKADPGGREYFGNMGLTVLTLFQIMTLDNWAAIAREMMLSHNWAWAPFIVFVIIAGFVIVNLIIAVICDAIGSLDDEEKANLHGDGQYDSDSQEGSQPQQKLELREQLDSLEDQMVNITRIQARTFHTLIYLTQQLRTQKEAKEKANELEKEVKRKKKNDDYDDDTGRRKSEVIRKEKSLFKPKQRYTDTFQGSEKLSRQASVSQFAQAARELKKLRKEQD